MRIEGTHTFLAPLDQIFATFTDPDLVRHHAPGCERLIQFGPAGPDDEIAWETRLRVDPESQIYTAGVTLRPVRAPQHLDIHARGQGPYGPVALSGSLDFVEQDERTVAAYALNLDAEGMPEELQRQLEDGAAERYVDVLCDGLGSALTGRVPGQATLEDALPLLRADTARGKIVLLPPVDEAGAGARLRTLAQRGALVGAGLVVGMLTLALARAIIRRWGNSRSAGANE